MPASNYDLQVDIAREIFLRYDQSTLIRKFRLDSDDAWIYLTYLNVPCRISRIDGRIEEFRNGAWLERRSFSTVMTVYDLLCYHKGAQMPSLAGQWCTVGNFVVTGVTNTGTFTKHYAPFFDSRPRQLKAACEAMGGTFLPRMAGADLTVRFPVTGFFPVLFQFWHGDEEFPPKVLLLWDRNADRFLHFETTFYLQGDLLQRLKQHMDP